MANNLKNSRTYFDHDIPVWLNNSLVNRRITVGNREFAFWAIFAQNAVASPLVLRSVLLRSCMFGSL